MYPGRNPGDYRNLPKDNPHIRVSKDGTLHITNIAKSHEGWGSIVRSQKICDALTRIFSLRLDRKLMQFF